MSRQVCGATIRRRCLRDGSSSWQVRWREHGKQIARNFGSRAEAEQFMRKVGVVKAAQSVVAASLTQPGRILDLVPEYVELVRAKNKPGSSHAEQVGDILRRSAQRMGVAWTSEIDTSALDRLVRAHGTHRSTLKKAVCTIKTFLRWAQRSRLLIDEWALDYQGPRHIPEERLSWSEEQVLRLLDECDKPNESDLLPSGDGTGRGSPEIMARMAATRDYLARRAVRTPMWLMLRYGPRPIEASKLTVADWDAKRRTLSFPARITKNGHARSFVVDTETADLLTAAAGTREARQPLFLTSKQRAWTSHHLTDVVTVLIERAKLPGTAYCCRHTACSRLIVLAKGDLPLVQSITGHRTLSELQRYLHATSERRHTIADAYDGGSVGLVENPSYLRVVP